MHLCQRFFQSSKNFSNSIFGIAVSSFSDAHLMSYNTKRRPFKVLFILGNRRKSRSPANMEAGASLQYCFWPKIHEQPIKCDRCIIVVQKPWIVLTQIRAFFSDCFTQTKLNLSVVLLIDRLTWWQEFTILLKSKNTVSITFTFDRTCRAFFGLGEPECLDRDDWDLVSTSYPL